MYNQLITLSVGIIIGICITVICYEGFRIIKLLFSPCSNKHLDSMGKVLGVERLRKKIWFLTYFRESDKKFKARIMVIVRGMSPRVVVRTEMDLNKEKKR